MQPPSLRFVIANEIEVFRLGFGALHLAGSGAWGPPRDIHESLRLLRRLPDLGVNLIDTADSYGPNISEELIRHALHPYRGLLIATKGGLVRHGPGRCTACGRPEYLREQIVASARRLGVERLDLWQLHRIDRAVPREEQFDAIRSFQKEGLIRHVGLSEVDTATIAAAQSFFPVATVQNSYNFAFQRSDPELAYCEAQGIGFMPWGPLGSGSLATGNDALTRIAQRHRATAAQIALAWLMQRSPNMLPIPGTSQIQHLEANVTAAQILLDPTEFAEITAMGGEQVQA